MNLPFSEQQFFEVFQRYNSAVWPLQILLVASAVAGLLAVWLRPRRFTRPLLLLLACLWLWMAFAYHLAFFATINPAARVFAIAFVAEAVLLATLAVRGGVIVRFDRSAWSIAGLLLIAYALVLYPVIGYLAGHRYPSSPTFGLPCPTTLYTFGVLLAMRPRRTRVLVIPVLWAAIASSAAFTLGVYEDGMLIVAALLSVAQLPALSRLRVAH